MTPVPKNLSPQQVRNWRRAVARGASPVRAAALAAGPAASPVRHRDGGDAQSLSRTARGLS